MLALLVFGIVLLTAVLISERADRTVISTAVLFLVAGVAAGEGGLRLIVLDPGAPVVSRLAEFALVAVLFTDAMKTGWGQLRAAWRLPGRALLLGLPLTVVATALFARYVAGVAWIDAWLIGAVLAPTDPVFAAAIVGREGVSERLRHLLNVESGLNDGLALPIVLGLLAAGTGAEEATGRHLAELAGGAAIGGGVVWAALRIERSRFFAVARSHEPLLPFALGVVVFALAEATGMNAFLAAFAAGATFATLRPSEKERGPVFFGHVAELLKLAALLVFAALISPRFLSEIPASGYVFALLALFVARPLALGASLLGAEMPWREKLAAMWFGPKGFASVVYGILVLESGVEGADQSFHLIALVVAGSIVAHSSTDVPMAKWLRCAAREAS